MKKKIRRMSKGRRTGMVKRTKGKVRRKRRKEENENRWTNVMRSRIKEMGRRKENEQRKKN
jgi:hypothetical protein